MTIRPLQYAIYKGIKGKFGAAQLNFQPPHFFCERQKDFTGELALYTDQADGRTKLREGWNMREGAVFIEVTSAVGPNQYNWEQKVTMALSIDDMGKILTAIALNKKLELQHDPGAGKETARLKLKTLTLDFPDPEQGCMLYCSQTAGGERVNHVIPVSRNEIVVIRTLLTAAISKALAW